MKKILFFTILSLVVAIKSHSQSLKGSWELDMQNSYIVILATDNYMAYSMYDRNEKAFKQTWGGPYTIDNQRISITIEFDNASKEEIGKVKTLPARFVGNFLKVSTLTFRKTDEGDETELAGNWRITARANATGEMTPMPLAARKTIKLLSGKRFQWIATNTETGEFFGTGGGTYTLEDGIYTETIEFFSRDASRVGNQLTFKAEVNDAQWVHSGKSSAGEAIKEIWEKQ